VSEANLVLIQIGSRFRGVKLNVHAAIMHIQCI
jgi:hypothetical protein